MYLFFMLKFSNDMHDIKSHGIKVAAAATTITTMTTTTKQTGKGTFL